MTRSTSDSMLSRFTRERLGLRWFESKWLKVYMMRNFLLPLFERAFKMMKNGVYFIVIGLLVAELFKILVYAN